MNPKKLNTSLLIALISITTFITSCTNHGKKINIEGTKGEIYYKGDGVTEDDARKLGAFLKESGYLDDKEKTVQIRKEGNNYTVRLVVDIDKVAKTADMDSAYTFYGASIASKVFNGTATVIVLCDKNMKDLKTYPYKPEILENAAVKKAGEIKEMNQKTFANNTMYFGKTVTEDEANGLFNYLKTSEFFTEEGSADLIVNKGENESALIQFPIQKEFANEEGLAKIDAFAKQMKAELFNGVTLSFEVIDTEFNSIKTFIY